MNTENDNTAVPSARSAPSPELSVPYLFGSGREAPADSGGRDSGSGGPATPTDSRGQGPSSVDTSRDRKLAGWASWVATVLAGVMVGICAGMTMSNWVGSADRLYDSRPALAPAAPPHTLKRVPGTIAAIAGRAVPSVVTIEVRDDWRTSNGTGFVYDKQGHILTTGHVVTSTSDPDSISATLSDGRKYEAEVVGHAEGYDVAVIKLHDAPPNLQPLPLGSSDQVSVGDAAIAIGAPLGLSSTVTTGIVSAKNRPVSSSDRAGSKTSYLSALQTDASINPGNSGGPLLDARGAVIGINSAIGSADSGGATGSNSETGSKRLGFAIPINQAKTVAQQLIKTGRPVYPVLGAAVSVESRTYGGALIPLSDRGSAPSVAKGGPADRAGLMPGDVITKVDGRPIDSAIALISELWTHEPGDTVTVAYKRCGEEHQADVRLDSKKGD